jgi:hypothetical protein
VEELFALLERKNLCFRSFHKLCSGFLDEIARGEISGLETFQRRRQALISVLEELEKEIAERLAGFNADPAALDARLGPDGKERIAALSREKETVVKSILDLDSAILAHIERIRNETVQKLQNINAGRKTIGAYRSPLENVESAEAKKILDQEA